MKAEALHPFYYHVFTLEELQTYFREAASTLKMQLFRLCKKGVLVRLKKNCYTFTHFPADSLLIGQKMVSPSYYSLETNLSRQGIIPEGVTAHTLVTSQKTQHVKTSFGTFFYRHLPPHLFFGVEKTSHGVWTATPEKALLDYLYLNSAKFKPDFACWQAERFDELRSLKWKLLRRWSPKFKMAKLISLIESLEKYSRSRAYQAHR